MRVTNFDKEMEKIIAIECKDKKPKLLLHSCCAPCSTACIERVKQSFDLTIYYYNPNLDCLEEYIHRSTEQMRFCESMGIRCIVEEYNKQEFLDAVHGLESEKEGGARCYKCFNLRLKKTADKAKELGSDYFATTLTVSPLKNANKLNEIGYEIQSVTGVKFLPSDFKKRGGYLRSVELSKQYELYRQNYCGCEFSKNAIPNK